ncbi:hypothetical protein [Fervidibacillus albus]|uniref:Uncharacterized protein n=1 Tax=Fervidibacillus albus TaxID=2980026 RepID=A0A9E8LU24_9BACI|nr:hypothetical protein [Fervidibacillus albus]WAA09638.1 hypothetical protein OE104_14125 [Fervidibacillus albus]
MKCLVVYIAIKEILLAREVIVILKLFFSAAIVLISFFVISYFYNSQLGAIPFLLLSIFFLYRAMKVWKQKGR